jgi:hypothetical protein
VNDPVGTIVAELRDAGIASGRVRGGEPVGVSADYEGDALGPGHYKRFVVVVRLGRVISDAVVLQMVRLGIRSYGVTPQDAGALNGDVGVALHNIGGRGTLPRWVFNTVEEEGGVPGKDPDTGQPYESSVVVAVART